MRLRSHGKRGLDITIMLCVGASFSLSLTRKLNLFFLPEGHYPWLLLTSANNIGCFAELSKIINSVVFFYSSTGYL